MSILLHHFAEMSCANFASCTSLQFVVFNLTSQQFARNAAISKALLAYWTSLQFVYFKRFVLFFFRCFSIFRFLVLPFFWRGAYCSLRKIYWVGAAQHPAEQEGAKSILQRRNLAACKGAILLPASHGTKLRKEISSEHISCLFLTCAIMKYLLVQHFYTDFCSDGR